MKKSWLVAIALLVTAACGDDGSPEPSGTGGTGGKNGTGGTKSTGGSGGSGATCPDDPGDAGSFPCEVGAIIEAKCQRCHTTEEAQAECLNDDSCLPAPFALLTWSDSRKLYGGTPIFGHIARVVESGSMPMKADGLTPPVESLTEDEKRTLIDWVEGCAPPSDSSCD